MTGIFCVICYFASFAHADGEGGILINFLYLLFYVLAFPSLYILTGLNIISETSLIIGLVVNSILYGLLIERIQYYFKTKKD